MDKLVGTEIFNKVLFAMVSTWSYTRKWVFPVCFIGFRAGRKLRNLFQASHLEDQVMETQRDGVVASNRAGIHTHP